MSLDLSDLPSLVQPAPPSNTLLITNLNDPVTFAAPTLAHIRELISTHSPAPIFAFAPLRSFRRIIVTFTTVEAAIHIRQMLDGESLFDHRIRVYFGEPTPVDQISERERHLQAPRSEKQFFISPPPSPPHGWESKEEDPPNKDVHAEDLAIALEKLSARRDDMLPVESSPLSPKLGARNRSSSTTILYQPEEHGNSPGLPAIAVEDLTAANDDWSTAELELPQKPMIHTSRPPVELM